MRKNNKKKTQDFNKVIRNLSPDAVIKPWYKKGGFIVVGSTLGIGVIASAITLPLVLITTTQETSELIKVTTVYDLNKKTAKLVVEGVNLPNDKTLYSVSKETTSKAFDPITTVTLNFISATEVNLDFSDPTITANTIYQVKLNNSTSTNNVMSTKVSENINQPSFTITTQPINVILASTGNNQNARFSVIASEVSNPIPEQSLSYQWKTSDFNTTDETKWSTIPNETNSTFTYDATDFAPDTKKYFKCIVSYKYVTPITSSVVSIFKTSQTTINIITEPNNIELDHNATSASLSVSANVVNEINNQTLAYQWQKSDTDSGSFVDVTNATSATYNLSSEEIASITQGAKKYYKCKISYGSITPVYSNVVYIEKSLTPSITIVEQPKDIDLQYATDIVTLSLKTNIVNGNSHQSLTYKWQTSKAQDGTFTDIPNATTNPYTLPKPQIGINYYRCVVTLKSDSSITVTSNPSTVIIRDVPFVILTHPTNKTLTSASTEFSLAVTATEKNQIGGKQITYQWKKCDISNGVFVNVEGVGTNPTYTKTFNAGSMNSWTDTWYKCEVSYDGAAMTSDPALVKMTLTANEAKAELVKWLAIEDNAISILRQYFNSGDATSYKNYFYNSLHDHQFAERNPSVVVDSITSLVITANNEYPTAYKSYKIRLKTTTPANITSKSSANSVRTIYNSGMIIEFNTLFSFGAETVEFHNTNQNSKNHMTLSPTFSTTSSLRTTIEWTSTSGTSPTKANPYKKGNYPVKFYLNANSTTPEIIDSVLLATRMENIVSGKKKYKMIPTYNVI